VDALFGVLRTCEVVQPDGEIVEYVVRDAEPFPEERSAWILVRDNDCEHRVSHYARFGPNRIRCTATGYWSCDCGDFKHRYRTVRQTRGPCKHLSAVVELVKNQTTETGQDFSAK
jgi:hypothetical protein